MLCGSLFKGFCRLCGFLYQVVVGYVGPCVRLLQVMWVSGVRLLYDMWVSGGRLL